MESLNTLKKEESFLNKAEEVIKKQFSEFLKPQNYEDQVWTVALDTIKNYKEYFPESNACNM